MGRRQLLSKTLQLHRRSLHPPSASRPPLPTFASLRDRSDNSWRQQSSFPFADSFSGIHAHRALSHDDDERPRHPPSSADLFHLTPTQSTVSHAAPNRIPSYTTRLLYGFAASTPSSLIRSASIHGDHIPAPIQGSFRARSCSSVAENRLEDDLGSVNSQSTGTVVGNTDAIVDTETLANLVTPQAQKISEVSAVIGDCSYPTAFLQMLIEAVHVHAALPWWAAIAVTTLGIRIMCIPVVVYQLRSAAKLSLMRPEMERINDEIKNSGYDPRVSAESRERIMALFAKHQTTPFSPFVGALLQAPIFMCFFFAIRNMAARVDSFKEGGFLWFSDLSAPDSTYILPLATCLGVLLTVELNAAEGMEGNPLADKMKKFMRIFAVLLFPISMNFEKALFFYWMTSNFWSLIQSTVMKRPAVKSYLQIPETAHLAKPENPIRPEPTVTAEPVKVVAAEPVKSDRPIKSIVRRKSRNLKRK